MIEAGWVTVADEPDYADNTVARVTDHVRTHIAASSTRGEDQLEKTDTVLRAIAAERLMMRSADRICVVPRSLSPGSSRD
jgi:hypothetical protein